uniref:Uncharacterized protein n=1 Tax=Ixodes ricinus TaxID=34613 RepID=A0A0K8R7S1_IXORI
MHFCLVLLLLVPGALCDGEEEKVSKVEPAEDVVYNVPKPVGFAHIAEHFDDLDAFKERWVLSEATKDGAESSVAKYDGKWQVEAAARNLLYVGSTLGPGAQDQGAPPTPSLPSWTGPTCLSTSLSCCSTRCSSRRARTAAAPTSSSCPTWRRTGTCGSFTTSPLTPSCSGRTSAVRTTSCTSYSGTGTPATAATRRSTGRSLAASPSLMRCSRTRGRTSSPWC